MSRTVATPADVFRQYGLRSTGFWRAVGVPPRNNGVNPGAKLRAAFEELGGIYLEFARFLSWRADLLGVDYLTALEQMQRVATPVAPERVAELLRRELGSASDELVREMELDPVWCTFSRTAYRTRYLGAPIVLQVAHAARPASEYANFEAGLKSLDDPDLERITGERVVREFREWLRHAGSCTRERSYLEVLRAHRDETLVEYPAVIPDISTDDFLCWPWVEGQPVRSLIQSGSSGTVTQIAAAVLEQYYMLSIIDAELDLDSMVVSPDQRLVMRRVSRPVSVPAPHVDVGMKYVAAVLAGDAAVTVQALVTMATGRSSSHLESALLHLLSGIEPELKVHLWYPGSAAAFESNWRALAKLNITRPLYLNCLHRNLIATGYWNGDAVLAGGQTNDAIYDAQLPVVSRLLQTQSSQFQDPATLREWAFGAGLLVVGAMRQANRLAEEMRENNLTMGIELEGYRTDPHRANRSVRMRVLAGFLLIAVLLSLRWGTALPQPLASLMLAIALGAMAALFWVVAKIG